MKFSDYVKQYGDANMEEAYIRFVIDNWEMYVIVSIREDGVVNIAQHRTQESFAESLIRHISRKDSHAYIFKKSDIDKFYRSGSDIVKILSRSNGKEVAKKIREGLRKDD